MMIAGIMNFEQYCFHYLQGDAISLEWDKEWKLDRLYIGDYVCIAIEVIILMGGITPIALISFAFIPLPILLINAMSAKATQLFKMVHGLACVPLFYTVF